MVYDANLMVRSTGYSTAFTTDGDIGTYIDTKGRATPLKGMTMRAVCTGAVATQGTVAIKVMGCATTNGTYVDLVTADTLTGSSQTPASRKKVVARFISPLRYIKAYGTVGGTSPSFANLEVAFGEADEYGYSV